MANLGHLTQIRHSCCKCRDSYSYQYVQYFRVSKQRCQRLRFLTCAQTLMRAIAHGGCKDTVRESAPEVDSGRKIPCRTDDSNPRQYCAWLFSRTLYQPSTLRAPLSGTFLQTLPDLVTPLKGHSLSPRSCPPTRSAPSERFEY